VTSAFDTIDWRLCSERARSAANLSVSMLKHMAPSANTALMFSSTELLMSHCISALPLLALSKKRSAARLSNKSKLNSFDEHDDDDDDEQDIFFFLRFYSQLTLTQ
jgi:hypothetical protein